MASEASVGGNKASFAPDVSATGRYVVFASDATNLVAGDTNGKRDVFLRDLQTGTTRLVSRGINGAKGNGPSYFPSVSNDGRYVAFMSDATNLVPGDTNGVTDAFRTDLSTGKTIRVSVATSGQRANGASGGVRMSANGDALVFGSAATNLAPRDTNNVNDVFLRDHHPGVHVASGNQNVHKSEMPSIAPDGKIVGFVGPVGLHDAVYSWTVGTRTPTMIDDDLDASFETVAASNGGVSYGAIIDYEGLNQSSWLNVVAQPATLSFQ